MDLELDGKVCVVTGASSGIGLETSRRLAAEGAQVLMIARDSDRLEPLAAEIGADFVATDVTGPEADERIVATCAEQMGGIDVLVNNAGTSFAKPLDELTDEDWNGQWELHVLAPMRLMRLAAPRMAQRGGGRIVNVCSSAGKRPSLTNAAYSVTKAAQLSLSRVFADQYAAENVLVNAVAPGAVGSELWTGPDGLAEQMGGIDVLINNAGTSFAKPLDELTDEDWNGQWELHVLAPMRLMRLAAPRMVQRGGGRIVNVCSSAGKRPSLTNAAYSVTKAAQMSLSRVFADSFASDNVLVNAVTPGPVASPLWMADGGLGDQTGAAKGMSRAEALEAQTSKVPLRRFAEPGEIADVVVFLSSARASTVTGAAWSADGGAVAIIV